MYRVVKKTESSGRDGKSVRRFSNFHFPKASKIELVCLEKLGHFIRIDSGMWLLPYFYNPVQYVG